MFFVGGKKRVGSKLKDNATAFSEADNMLFGSELQKSIKRGLCFYKKSRIIQGGKYRAALSKKPPI